MAAPARGLEKQWKNKEGKNGGDGDHEYHAENGDAEIDFPIDALLETLIVQDLAGFQSEE
jgi:hypothetical protein